VQTVGPFTGVDGRQFWFDFYRLVRLVPVYFAGFRHLNLIVIADENRKALIAILLEHFLLHERGDEQCGAEPVERRRAPYGGIKQSGIGRKASIEGVLEYMQLQTITTHGEF